MWHRALFCGTELGFCTQPLQPWFVKETAFFFAKAQNLRIRLVPNSWDSYAGFFWHRALSCDTELRFGIEIPLIYATAECQNLRIRLVPNSWIICFVLWHRAGFVAQSFVLAAFATLVCQRNCVFLCKGTKLKNSACAEFLG